MKTIKFAILVAGLVLSSIQSQGQPSFLTNQLVAYYPFNGNANDATTNANNGTVYGATLMPDRFGNPNSAYFLNGNSAYILISNAPANQLPAQFTVSYWIDPIPGYGTPVPGPDGDCQIISKWGDGGPGLASYNFGITGIGQLYISTSDGANASTQAIAKSITTTGAWHQVVIVDDGTNFYLYRDNAVLIKTNSLMQPQQNSVYDLSLGREQVGQYAYYGGGLDDIRIYDRALCPNEVAQLYGIESGQTLSIVKAITIQDFNLTVGSNYQVQVSSDLVNWTNYGGAFTATNSYWQATNYWNVQDFNQFYFRLLPQ